MSYQFNWTDKVDGEDYIRAEDVNSLAAAIRALADQVAVRAGYYTGNGVEYGDTQEIGVGFSPSAVILRLDGGSLKTTSTNVIRNVSGYTGIATRELPYSSYDVQNAIQVTESGFLVTHGYNTHFNVEGKQVQYVALR